MKGIDVSSHQGSIRWPEVAASGIRFAMIRAGYGNDASQKDTCFDANVRGALAAGLEVGAYWFSYAVSPDDAAREAALFCKILAPYRGRITFPAAFDYEGDSVRYAKQQGVNPTPELINRMADAFLRAVAADGWKPALYTNNDYRRNIFAPKTLAAWNVWLADYSGEACAPCAVRQTASDGHVNGISGCVDTDIAFRDDLPSVWQDTTGVYRIAPGGVYQLKTVCSRPPKVRSAGSAVLVLPRYRSGNDDLWWIVAVGRPGEKAAIDTSVPGGQESCRLTVEIVHP